MAPGKRYIPPHRRRQTPSSIDKDQGVAGSSNDSDSGKDDSFVLCNAFDRICCINLATRQDKWRGFRQHALRVGTCFYQKLEKFDAIDGSKSILLPTTANDVALEWDSTQNALWDRHVEPGIKKTTPGEIGCALSHVALWRELASTDDPNKTMLILEDDAEFLRDKRSNHASSSRFLDAFSKVFSALPEDWGILYLGFSDRGDRIPVQTDSNRRRIESLRRAPGCTDAVEVELFRPTYGFQTHAYAITCAAATTILSSLPVVGPIDVWLADNQWFDIKVYCGVVKNEGWRGTGAWLAYQRKDHGSDVGQSGRSLD